VRGEVPAFSFQDPLAGRGGLGASTAQFALVYRALAESQGWELSWKAVWKFYRELTATAPGVPPSGADLAAQWEGGVVRFDISSLSIEKPNPDFDWAGLLVFSATSQSGRKVATHRHLGDLSGKDFSSLEPSLRAGFGAVEAADSRAFGRAMAAYGDALAAMGLEVDATAADRREFSRLPGVLGVKGAGALQSDAILVMMERGADHAAVIECARMRGLVLAADGLVWEKGVSNDRC
jgi:mevalonate kinase